MLKQHLAVTATQRQDLWWQQRHQQKLLEKQQYEMPEGTPSPTNKQLDLLLLGDSITHAWEVEGEAAWQQYFGHLNSLNLGYAGDCTEHLLWRIQHGEVAKLKPKSVVLLIGTNNAGHRLDSPEAITLGVQAILSELQARLPNTAIILMALFPRSRNQHKPMRQRINATNQLIQQLANNSVHWLDIGGLFLDKNQRLDESMMPDLLHLNDRSYGIWAKQLASFIKQHSLINL